MSHIRDQNLLDEEGLLSLHERFFYRIALNNRLIAEAQVDEAIRHKMRLLDGRGEDFPLDEILVRMGVLSPSDVELIHEAQAASQVLRLDSLYADLVLHYDYCPVEVLEQAFEAQRKRAYRVRVGELLVNHGMLSGEQHRQILLELLRALEDEEKAYMRQIRDREQQGPARRGAPVPPMRQPDGSGAPSDPELSPPAPPISFLETQVITDRDEAAAAMRSAPKGRRAQPAEAPPSPGPVMTPPPPEDEAVPLQFEQTEIAKADAKAILARLRRRHLERQGAQGEASEKKTRRRGRGRQKGTDTGDSQRTAALRPEERPRGRPSGARESQRLRVPGSSDSQRRQAVRRQSATGASGRQRGIRPGSGRQPARAAPTKEPGTRAIPASFLQSNMLKLESESFESVDAVPGPPPGQGSGRHRAAGGSGRRRPPGGSGRHRKAGGSGRHRRAGGSGGHRRAGGSGRGAARARRTDGAERGKRGKRGEASGSGRRKARVRRLMQGAVAAQQEMSSRSPLKESDVLFVKSDLQNVEDLIESGYRNFEELGKLKESSEPGEVFDTEHYLKRKRRQAITVRSAIILAVLLVGTTAAVLIYTGWSNSEAYQQGRNLMQAGDYEGAARVLEEAGSFWVGAERLDSLRQEVDFKRRLGEIEAMRREGEWAEALALSDDLEADLGLTGERFFHLKRHHRELSQRIAYEQQLEAGKAHEAAGELRQAVEAYGRAMEIDAGGDEAESRRDRLRSRLLSQIPKGEGGSDPEGLRTAVAACERYMEAFHTEDLGRILERKNVFTYRLYLIEGDRDRESALLRLGKSGFEEHLEAARTNYKRAQNQYFNQEIVERIASLDHLAASHEAYRAGQEAEGEGRYGEARTFFEQALEEAQRVTLQLRVDAWLDQLEGLARDARRQEKRQSDEAHYHTLYAEGLQAIRASKMAEAERTFGLLRDHLDANGEFEPGQRERVLAILAFLRDVAREMVYVPPGPFVRGSDEGRPNEKPERAVHLSGFFIDRHEVTNRSYRTFLISHPERPPPSHWQLKLRLGNNREIRSYGEHRDEHPVVNVSWEDAVAYARSAGKRLPSEAEWEKAARGTDGRTYPWGDEAAGKKANIDAATASYDPIPTRPAGAFPKDVSPYGCTDMAGNVREWTADWYDLYEGAPERSDPEVGRTNRVVRGGAWKFGAERARCTYRDAGPPSGTFTWVGFRGAVDVPEVLREDLLASDRPGGD